LSNLQDSLDIVRNCFIVNTIAIVSRAVFDLFSKKRNLFKRQLEQSLYCIKILR